MTIEWPVEANGQRLVVRGGNESTSPRAGKRSEPRESEGETPPVN